MLRQSEKIQYKNKKFNRHTLNGIFKGTNQETVSGSDISWAICKSDNHASTPPLSFYRPDALSVSQSTVSKH